MATDFSMSPIKKSLDDDHQEVITTATKPKPEMIQKIHLSEDFLLLINFIDGIKDDTNCLCYLNRKSMN